MIRFLSILVFTTGLGVFSGFQDAGLDAGTLDLDAGLTLDSLSDKNYALNTIVTPLSEARGPYRQGGGNFSQTLY